VVEGARKCSNHPETETRPECDGAVIGADNEIELHSPVAQGLRFFQGKFTHLTASTISGRCDEARIPDMSTAT